MNAQYTFPPDAAIILKKAGAVSPEACYQLDENASSHELASIYAGETFADGFLNKLELKSIAALIAYIAATESMSIKAVRSFVETAFGVEDLRRVEQGNYNSVVRFLVDMKLNETLN